MDEDKIKLELKKYKENNIKKYGSLLNTLTGNEKQVLELYFGLLDGKEYSLKEISEKIMPKRPIMEFRVRQFLAKALRKIDYNLKED